MGQPLMPHIEGRLFWKKVRVIGPWRDGGLGILKATFLKQP